MKKLIVFALILFFGLAARAQTISQQAYLISSQPVPVTTFLSNKDKPKISPKYLLVLRYWTGMAVSYTTYPSQNIGADWTYLNETYTSIDEVLARLNQQRFGKEDFVGLWELGKQKVIHHEKERKVEVDA